VVWLKRLSQNANGKMMKDSAHKGMKKMAKGGSVKKGCDGVATKGKTKGRMMV
jgi:hypothetical protein